MCPDGHMDQQTDRWMDDGDMRESAEGEKHFKLDNKQLCSLELRSEASHRNDTWMLEQ